MADSKLGYVTFTQIVKIGDGSSLTVHTHVLPLATCEGEGKAKSPYSWFNDRINQELLVFVHDILHAKATENIRIEFEGADPSGKSVSGKDYEFRKSSSFRGLFVFKPSNIHHHILIPRKSSLSSPSKVCAAFVNDYGRRVLPFLDSPTSGKGYNSYKVVSESLHTFVDHCEVTSSLGIFKVLKHLDPKHKVALDIASYFKHSDTTSSYQPGNTDECFPEVPLAGLRQRHPKKKANYKHHSKKAKPTLKSSNQPLISKAFDKCTTKINTPKSPTLFDEMDLPSDVIDTFFDFESQNDPPPAIDVIEDDPGVCDSNELIEETVVDRDATPPLDHPPKTNSQKSKVQTNIAEAGQSCELVVSTHRSNVRYSKKFKSNFNAKLSDLIHASGMKGKSLALKKSSKTLSKSTQDSANEEATVDYHLSQEDQRHTSDYDNYSFVCTPPTPDLIPQTSSVNVLHGGASLLTQSNIPLNFEGDLEQDGVSSSFKKKKLCSPLSGRTVVLDDVTNTSSKSTTPVSSDSSCESMTDAALLYTAEDMKADLIQISSGEDEVVCTGSQEGRKRKRKIKTTLLTLEEVISGAMRVGDLTKNQIIQWIRLRKPVILDIFKGKEDSERHADYLAGAKKRATLKYRVDTSMFGEDQLDCLNTNILNMFCAKNMKYFDYVMSVLIPECVVRLIADVMMVTFDEAEQIMYKYESVDLSQE